MELAKKWAKEEDTWNGERNKGCTPLEVGSKAWPTFKMSGEVSPLELAQDKARKLHS